MAILDVKRCVPAFLVEEESVRFEKPTIIGGYPSVDDAKGKLHSIATNLMENRETFTCGYGSEITWYKKVTDEEGNTVQAVHARFRVVSLARVIRGGFSLNTDAHDIYGFLDRY